jgi:hypothetical protein
MHHFYSSVGFELMQQDISLENKDKLELTQVRSVACTLLPLTCDGPHWILQDMKRKMLPLWPDAGIENARQYFFAMVHNESRPVQVDPLWSTKRQEEKKTFLNTVAKNGSIQFPAREKTFMRSVMHCFRAESP